MLLYWPIRIYKSLRFRFLNYLAKRRSRPIFKAATQLVLARRQTTFTPLQGALEEKLSVLLSYRVTDEERLNILQVVAKKVGEALKGQKTRLLVSDASGPEFQDRTRQAMESIGLPLHYDPAPQKLAPAYAALLRQTETKYFYLQFDDFLTAGLTPQFLGGCCDVLEKYEGLVGCVAIMWPHAVRVDSAERSVLVTDYATQPKGGATAYHFGFGKPQLPLFVEEFGGYRFGIFRNFNYGFFFNHLVAPTADYLQRLEWYREHVSADSVHAIEMAAEHCTIGPFFTHIAICLDNVCLLDLDYSHTPSAVRPQAAINKEVCDAVAEGYTVKVGSR